MQHRTKKYAIALDVGGSAIKAALVERSGRITFEGRVDTEHARRPEDIVKRICATIDTLVERAGGRRAVAGVGLGVPGPLDPRRGIIYFTPNLPFKKSYHLAAVIQRHARMPVVMQNDANVAALGEVWQGAGRHARVAVLLTLGTGIGGGVIIDGKIFDGAFGQGAELGHFPFGSRGRRCGAGHPGCFEPVVSRFAMVREARRFVGQPGAGRTHGARDARIETALDVHRLAEAGNAKARAYFNEYGRRFGVLTAYLLNVFNPDVVLFGGAMSGSFKFFGSAVKKEAARHAFASIYKEARIKRAVLGNRAGILGAAKLVFDK